MRLLKYVEISTKVTSVLTFLYTLAFLAYSGFRVNILPTLVFFVAMLLFDLCTTAINNYIDSRTNGQDFGLKRTFMFAVIIVLFALSTALGLLLVYLTDIVVLAAGVVCFVCGVLYTAGPVPISRLPLGEFFSGIFYGLLLPFILIYINTPTGYLFSYALTIESLGIHIQLFPMLALLLFSVTPVCITANIMLANNICDVKKDVLVKRYTLPYFIGKNALHLYAALYISIFISVVAAVILDVFPVLSLLSLAAFIPVHKNIKTFYAKHVKEETFITSIQNFVLLIVPNTILLFVAALLK